ncbi:hypothetical protein JRO89_XSUnG0169000 [Xanthoceras sorbifolium]|uniref:Vacuolar protein sorting-associated protein 55 homolog n=1 Tax=Xanthoceras sorbifolium TaxID=99658 RepID=A0ABQ8GXM2_9ROSI|nr:hypothetical protein JRO89_XSUnG0169000 [Xanthoceras sorbifolium]
MFLCKDKEYLDFLLKQTWDKCLQKSSILHYLLKCMLTNRYIATFFVAVIMYVLLPLPVLFLAGSDSSSSFSESNNRQVPFPLRAVFKGASAVGSIAIPVILKHAGVIGWGALLMELSSFFIFVLAIMCYIGTSEDDYYSSV